MKASGGKVLSDFLESSEPEFAKYFDHVRNLGFTDEPSYALLKGLLEDRMKKEGWEFDYKYDWLVDGKTLAPEDYRFDDTVFPVLDRAYDIFYF